MARKAHHNALKLSNAGQPFNELLLSQFRLGQYFDLVVQGVTIAICAGLAVFIACLGLFGLSSYTTERRTKEIGVRKVMGANTLDVVLLLLWQFTVPVLVATAAAIPLGALAMNWWLHGFVYHAPLSAWTFVLAAVAAVAIAWCTVSWRSFSVAKAKPAGALQVRVGPTAPTFRPSVSASASNGSTTLGSGVGDFAGDGGAADGVEQVADHRQPGLFLVVGAHADPRGGRRRMGAHQHLVARGGVGVEPLLRLHVHRAQCLSFFRGIGAAFLEPRLPALARTRRARS